MKILNINFFLKFNLKFFIFIGYTFYFLSFNLVQACNIINQNCDNLEDTIVEKNIKLEPILEDSLDQKDIIFKIKNIDAKKIGMQIWENEASKKPDLLVFWNKLEPFPSLGIGHFIWYPIGYPHTYTEQFPLLCAYMKKMDVKLPNWLDKIISKENTSENQKILGAPWANRDEFIKDEAKREDLKKLLIGTIDIQTNFIINQFLEQIPNILKALPKENKKQISNYINLMLSEINGTYALIDYLNFKGSGLVSSEKINNQGWGLLQVLLDLPGNLTKDNLMKAFSLSCAKILIKRIENSNPNYKFIVFLNGWIKRVSTYFSPATFSDYKK